MYFNFLLNNVDRICLGIITQLSSPNVHNLERNKLMDQYDLTSYQLNKYIELLNEDLSVVSERESSFVEEMSRAVLKCRFMAV